MDDHSHKASIPTPTSHAESSPSSLPTAPVEILARLGQLCSGQTSYTVLYSLIQRYPSSPPPDPDQADELHDALSLCLGLACRAGDVSAVESVFELWTSLAPTPAPEDGTLLQWLVVAAREGRVEIVRCLLLHGAKVTPIVPGLVAANAQRDVDLREVFRAFIRDGGWDINDMSEDTKPAMRYIIDRPDLLTSFLDWGADPNALGPDGLTPLDGAAGVATPSTFDLLLAKGAKLRDCYPLHQAVARHGLESTAIEMIDHLLDLGVDINAIQFQNHPERVQMIDLDKDLGTPLHCAARSGSYTRVVHLLEKGADSKKHSSKGNSVLSWAEEARRPKSHPDVLKLLH